MCLDRAVLAGASVQPRVGSDPVTTKENFNDILREPYVHLLLNVFIRNRIVLEIYANMVVELDSGNSPCG